MTSTHITEFSVLIPSDFSDQSREVMDRFKTYLEMQFPGYTFSIATMVRMVDSRELMDIQDFLVIPHMGSVGDGAKIFLKQMPDRDLVEQITWCCRRYKFDGRAGLAA